MHKRALLNSPNLIMGGDLNLTMHSSKIWGKKVVLDPLSSFFKQLFDSMGLIDTAPTIAGPTWRNSRVGDEGISKRLDRFLIASSLIPTLLVHWVWTHTFDISNHYHVSLEWNKSLGSYNYPFKFNRSWLNDQDFVSWVTDRWSRLSPSSPGSELDHLSHKFRSLKMEVKDWIKEKGSLLESKSQRLDVDINTLLSSSSFGILSQDEQTSLSQLRIKKKRYWSTSF